jgi:hypothetical protein
MMSSEPVLWLESKVWFTFLAKRVQVIRDTQRHLFSKDPANYGIMTGLFTYMLQSVIFTPTLVSSFVNESLALLRYRQVVDRFGMFFLHNLDLGLEKCLPEVLSKDDLDVLSRLGVKLKKKSRPRMPSPDDNGEIFPLGKEPTWSAVQGSLRESPWVLMRAWSWSPELDNLDRVACRLFQLFTVHIWAALHDTWRTDSDTVCPTTLKEALNCWTFQEIHRQTKMVTFIACNAGLCGIDESRRVRSFAERRELYFPPSLDGLSCHWETFATEPGYINEYHRICDKRSVEDIIRLNDHLEELLSNCQCLPNSCRGGSQGKSGRDVVWDIKNKCVVILTNPLFYKLQKVGNGGQQRKMRRAPTHTAKKQLLVSFLEHQGVTTRVAKRAVNWSKSIAKRRSGKAKNRRAPPQRNPAKVDESGFCDDDEDPMEVDDIVDNTGEKPLQSDDMDSDEDVDPRSSESSGESGSSGYES